VADDIEVPTVDPPTVCIVDDDASCRQALVRLVRGHGLKVEGFAWPGQLLRRLAAGRLDCAVLVLDVHLGSMSGFELFERVTRSGASIPTIFMTGIEDATDRERVSRIGAGGYLVKPFEDAVLIGAIRNALEGREAS
jgi:FixJ family two-component response regulator